MHQDSGGIWRFFVLIFFANLVTFIKNILNTMAKLVKSMCKNINTYSNTGNLVFLKYQIYGISQKFFSA